MSLTSDRKKTLRDATWGVAGEQQASGADEPPAEPAQTAPKLFQNNEFDTIPELNSTRFAYLAGTARLVNGTWTFDNTKIRSAGTAGTAVYVASQKPWTGVIKNRDLNGWLVKPDDGTQEEGYFPLTSETTMHYSSVFLVQD